MAAFAGLTPALAGPSTVIVFGDSITEGGALQKNERAQLWVRQVELQSKGRLLLKNEGKGGRPTASVSEFEDMLRRSPRPDILVLALGTNDSRNIRDSCIPNAAANLESMISKARHLHGSQLRILLVAPPNIRKDCLGPTAPIADQRDAKLRELGAAFQALASRTGCEFVSLYGVVPESTLTRDGVHPDGDGNAPIARTLLGKLLQMAPAPP